LRVGEGDGDDAIFEAEGWEADRVVFSVKVCVADAVDELFAAV
jgi:hypothetical protein